MLNSSLIYGDTWGMCLLECGKGRISSKVLIKTIRHLNIKTWHLRPRSLNSATTSVSKVNQITKSIGQMTTIKKKEVTVAEKNLDV